MVSDFGAPGTRPGEPSVRASTRSEVLVRSPLPLILAATIVVTACGSAVDGPPPLTPRPDPVPGPATAALCEAIASAHEAVLRSKPVTAGIRLTRGIAFNRRDADPLVVAAAKRMLAGGLAMDEDRYMASRALAAGECGRAGSPIEPPPIMCLVAPCPQPVPSAASTQELGGP
jgi:hypothetical protein